MEEEVFEIIKAVNRLKDKIQELCVKIDSLLTKPKLLVWDKDHVENEEACRFLHVSPTTLKLLRKAKKIPYIKFRRKILYKTDDLKKYLEDNRN
jgi:excisionase family DNA binding protein